MSSIVSRRPSFRNQSNEAFWMSIRFGRSRTCFRREKLFRARGAATLLVKWRCLPLRLEKKCGQAELRRDPPRYRKGGCLRKRKHARAAPRCADASPNAPEAPDQGASGG